MTGIPTSLSLQAANVVTAPALGATASSLPVPTLLGEFELTGVLGKGDFSVVYLAIDHSLDRTVAIKEYMPSAIAVRQPDGSVVPRSPRHEDTFKAKFCQNGTLKPFQKGKYDEIQSNPFIVAPAR